MNQYVSAAEIVLRHFGTRALRMAERIRARHEAWRVTLRAARAYSARHAFRSSRPIVTPDTPEAERAARYVPVPAADPWLEYMTAQRQNTLMIMSSQEGPLRRVDPAASLVGRNSSTASEEPSTAEFMRTVQSWSHPNRRHRSDNRGRLQRTTARIPAWKSTV